MWSVWGIVFSKGMTESLGLPSVRIQLCRIKLCSAPKATQQLNFTVLYLRWGSLLQLCSDWYSAHIPAWKRQVEGRCRSSSGRFGYFCRWEECRVKDKCVFGVKEVDSVMVRYSCDRYEERKQLLKKNKRKKETHFQNRGKNWAPVPDLCKLKLSVGSPCYDTCWGKIKKKKRKINKWEECSSKVGRWWYTAVSMPPHSCSASLLWCLYELCGAPDVPIDTRVHLGPPPPFPSMSVSCAHALNNQMSNQKVSKNKKLSLSFSALLSFFLTTAGIYRHHAKQSTSQTSAGKSDIIYIHTQNRKVICCT